MGVFRFLLALSVVVAHSSSGTLLGRHFLLAATAVQAFYIVSGFLITMVLNERTQYQNTLNFYLSRYLRLWPTYIVVAILTFIFFTPSTLWTDLVSNGPIPTIFVIFSNLTLFCQDWLFFLAIDHGALVPTANFNAGSTPQLNAFLLVPQAWTLGVELTFYLVAPFLCRRPAGVAALFAIGLAIKLAVSASNPPMDPWYYRFAPAEMMLFGAGGLSYFAGRWMKDRFSHSVRKYGPIFCLAILAMYIVEVPYITTFLQRSLGNTFFSGILWLANPGFLVVVALSCPALFDKWRNAAWDNFLGELSFPIYISHLFVAEALRRAALPGELLPDNLLYVACVVAFSWALFVFVGRPVDRLRASLGARVPDAPDLHGFAAAKNLAP